MSILITGGGGLIAAALVRRLLAEGETRITLFDIDPSLRLLDDVTDRFEFLQGDLGSGEQVENLVRRARPRVVFHLGGMLSLGAEENPMGAFQANAAGTMHLLEAARRHGVAQVLFSSTMATYGSDLGDGPISDTTLQRPLLFYGATKVFGEHLGLFYRRKYDLDFRGLRFPAIVGPGVKSEGIAQYKSRVIEQCALGRPYTIYVRPETRHDFLYVKDAARALVELGRAPRDKIVTVNYVIAGVQPPPSAAEIAEIIKRRIPGARIDFEVNPVAQAAMAGLDRPRDDSNARREWGWSVEYGVEETVEEFLADLTANPDRYT